MTIAIDTIEGFGTAIECEILTDKAHAEEAKQEVKDYMKDLGISEDNIVKKTITNMLMNKLANFS